jgi:hypothetical protein
MVFGLFEKGKIEIVLNKVNFTPGEVIEGTVKMQLNKPVKARGVFVTLFSGVTSQNINTFSKPGTIKSSSSTKRGFEFTQPLDMEKEYPTQPVEYNFKINIPANNGNIAQGNDPMSGVINTVKLFTMGNQYTKWFVEAKLDVPGGFDLNKKVQINLS